MVKMENILGDYVDYYVTRGMVCKTCNCEFFDWNSYEKHKCIEPQMSIQEEKLIREIAKEFVKELRKNIVNK
jgi:hypothetical protein